jgi:biopolymer transport protein ExbD
VKFRAHSHPKTAELQLAPMIDVVFLLLIFFIVSWNFARFEVDPDVKVPDVETSEQTSRVPGEIIINVTNDGRIKISNEVMTKESLLIKLSGLASRFPDQPVILRGHKTVPFKHVMTVLDTCQKAGIWNVAFAAEQPGPSPAQP